MALLAAPSICGCIFTINPDFVSETGDSSSQGDSNMQGNGCDEPCVFLGQPLSCAEGLCLGTVELSGLEDTFVRSNDPDSNYDSESVLHVELGMHIQRAYIGLAPLDALEAELAQHDATLHELTLQLEVKRGGPELSVYRVQQPWSADQVTWSAAPSFDASPLIADWPIIEGSNSIDLLQLPASYTELGNGLALLPAAETNPEASDGLAEIHSLESGRGPRIEAFVSWSR